MRDRPRATDSARSRVLFRLHVFVTAALAMLVGIHSLCGDAPRPLPTITLNPRQASVEVGRSITVSITGTETQRELRVLDQVVGPRSCSATNRASNSIAGNVLTVTGLNPGDCSIIVGYDPGLTAELRVTVTEYRWPVADASAPDASDEQGNDSGTDEDGSDGGTDAAPIAHLYVSDKNAGTVARFDVSGSAIEASSAGSFASGTATGMAFGPAGVLYVGNGSTGAVAAFQNPKTTPTALTSLPAPTLPANWSTTGVVFVPTTGGAGELWTASANITDTLLVYSLDNAGSLVSGPVPVATGIATSAGAHGIQGLAFDPPSNSFFVAASAVRRLKLTRGTGTWTLAPMVDAALSQLGATNPVGVAIGPNRWLFASYPVPSALNLGYWSVTDTTSTFISGATGVNNTFSPLGLTILPTEGSTPPIRVYTSTQTNQVVALDVAAAGVPKLDSFVCNAPAPSWIVAGD
jgi:hypothetical protein